MAGQIAVILLEPAKTEMGPPESELTLEQQVNEVFLFADEDQANAWITLFQGEDGAPGFRFLITPVSDPAAAMINIERGRTNGQL